MKITRFLKPETWQPCNILQTFLVQRSSSNRSGPSYWRCQWLTTDNGTRTQVRWNHCTLLSELRNPSCGHTSMFSWLAGTLPGSLFTVKQLHRDEDLPVQLYPSPMNPSLQVHVAPPGVLLQTARALQPPLLIAQCFMSSTPPDAMTSVLCAHAFCFH